MVKLEDNTRMDLYNDLKMPTNQRRFLRYLAHDEYVSSISGWVPTVISRWGFARVLENGLRESDQGPLSRRPL